MFTSSKWSIRDQPIYLEVFCPICWGAVLLNSLQKKKAFVVCGVFLFVSNEQTPKPKYSRWKKIFTSTSELMHSRRIFTALNSRYLETSSLHIIKATLTLGKKINSIFKVNQNALSVLWFPKGEERTSDSMSQYTLWFRLVLFSRPRYDNKSQQVF